MEKIILDKDEVVGLIPAAGKASRLGNMPLSKELYPVGFENKGGIRVPKTVSSYLLDQMADAGILCFHIILRKGKWDIPDYYGGGEQFNKKICYQVADYGYGVPFSINQAYPFIKDKTVAFGFPDILIKPPGVFNQLITKFNTGNKLDVIFGMFPSPDLLNDDKVDNAGNEIKHRHLKTEKGKQLNYTWIVAVWRPSFSGFLNDYLNYLIQSKNNSELLEKEYRLDDIFILAQSKGFNIEYVFFENGKYIDIGTPQRLMKAKSFTESML